jgi:acetyltransferase-like isoleucine patch superfamily enzyme
MPFVYNPWRRSHPSRRQRVIARAVLPLTRLGLAAGFVNIDYSYVHGDARRLILGQRCSIMNTLFNTVSGEIRVGDDTLFSHNCMVLTGTHRFVKGERSSLSEHSDLPEVPSLGRDVVIGRGCFIGAGSIIIGPVTIGDNVRIGAGSVVTRNIPGGAFAAGVPADVLSVDSPGEDLDTDGRS